MPIAKTASLRVLFRVAMVGLLCVLAIPAVRVFSDKAAVTAAVGHSAAIIDENQIPGTEAWRITTPSRAHELEGYAGATSVPSGENPNVRTDGLTSS